MLEQAMQWTHYSDFVRAEYRQCRAEGRDVADLEARVAEVESLPPSPAKERRARALVLRLERQPFLPGRREAEPDSYEDITALLPGNYTETFPFEPSTLPGAIKGGWFGRLAGCLLGLPVESWLAEKAERYLKETGAWPLAGFFSGAAPAELRKKYGIADREPGTPYDRQCACWIEQVEGFPVDDDINYTLLALKVLERFGRGFTAGDVAHTWLHSLPGFHACTAERAAYRNLMNGLPPPASAHCGNPWREMIGAQIRADLYGYINPGNPATAAGMAHRDTSLSHTGNGLYGAMFTAALISLCHCPALSRGEIVGLALRQIPPHSRLALAIGGVLAQYVAGEGYEAALAQIRGAYPETELFHWGSVFPNCLLVAANFLWHGEDYTVAVTQTVMEGYDTDCNGATVGSAVGLRLGFDAIDDCWKTPVQPVISSAVHGYERMSVDEAAARTLALIPH